MTILKWISIILFLLLVASIIIAILTTFFITVSSIINVFRKYPEISKHWFKEESYETYHYGGDYKSFEPYETKEGAIISVSRSDGQRLYDLKETVKFLLFALIIAILMFGAYNTSSLLGGILC